MAVAREEPARRGHTSVLLGHPMVSTMWVLPRTWHRHGPQLPARASRAGSPTMRRWHRSPGCAPGADETDSGV
jgi:hypothetical protein